jgi:hypothetical protein
MYLILAGSVTVFAQLQLQDMETSGDTAEPAEHAENEPDDKVNQEKGQSEIEATEPDVSNTSGIKPVSTDEEYAIKAEDQGEIENVNGETDEVDASGPSDEDFNPDEEISEDYPIPLPSDI